MNQKRVIILLGLLFCINAALFYLPWNPFNTTAIINEAIGVQIPDIMVFYTPDQLYDFLTLIGEGGRAAFQGMHLTVDLAFPLIYGLFFFFLMKYLLPNKQGINKFLPFICFLAVEFDLAENFTLIFITDQFPEFIPNLSKLAQGFTLLKFSFIFLSLCLILYFGMKRLLKNRSFG